MNLNKKQFLHQDGSSIMGILSDIALKHNRLIECVQYYALPWVVEYISPLNVTMCTAMCQLASAFIIFI